jgi:hypothetical protein
MKVRVFAFLMLSPPMPLHLHILQLQQSGKSASSTLVSQESSLRLMMKCQTAEKASGVRT